MFYDIKQPTLTDDEAESKLPHYGVVLERYRSNRHSGHTPNEAFRMTMAEWRALCHSFAFVPHQATAQHSSAASR